MVILVRPIVVPDGGEGCGKWTGKLTFLSAITTEILKNIVRQSGGVVAEFCLLVVRFRICVEFCVASSAERSAEKSIF